MKLLDFLEEYQRIIEFQTLELERKNQILRKNNEILKNYLQIEEKGLDRLAKGEGNNQSALEPTDIEGGGEEEAPKVDVVASLPTRLDEILKLAKSTRATPAEKKEQNLQLQAAKEKKDSKGPALTGKDKDRKLSDPKQPLKSDDVTKPQRMSLSTYMKTTQQPTAAPSEPTKKEPAVQSTQLQTQPLLQPIKKNIYAEYKQEVSSQLLILSKVRLFSRLKGFFLPNEKLLQSRNMIYSTFGFHQSNLIYQTFRKFYNFPSLSSLGLPANKDFLSYEMTRLLKMYSSSTGVKYLSHKINRPTMEMMEELFVLWYYARNVQELIFLSFPPIDQPPPAPSSQQLSNSQQQQQQQQEQIQEIAFNQHLLHEILRHFHKPFLFTSFHRNLLQYNQLLQHLQQEKLRFNPKQSQHQPNPSSQLMNLHLYANARTPIDVWTIQMNEKIDRHYNQSSYLLQYFLERMMTKKLILLNEIFKSVLVEQEKQQQEQQQQVVVMGQENQWIYILKLFRSLHTILVNHGNKSNCVFIRHPT